MNGISLLILLFLGLSIRGLNAQITDTASMAVQNKSEIKSKETDTTPSASTVPPGEPIQLPPIIVTATALGPGESNRQQIDLSAGTSMYTLDQQQINTIGQGQGAKFNEILAHTPGVSDDSYGSIHFRGEDPYYRYYINGTLLPSGINGFDQDIDTRFVQSVTTKVGALSAYYPEGNYGIVDIRTKTGTNLNGGAASFYGGSYDTAKPTFSYGGSSGGTDFYFTGSYIHDSLGLENPTSSSVAIHDETNQYKGFAYVSRQLGDAGRLSFVFSGSAADYQIPNTPGQVTSLDFSGTTTAPTPVDSSSLNETQHEQTYYGFIAYQQTIDDFSLQISQVNRYSSVLFNPDMNGDLYFSGVAGRVSQYILTNGAQADFTYHAGDSHTIRAGFLGDTQGAGTHNSTQVYNTDPSGNPMGDPYAITDDHFKRGYDFAFYIQDEWKVTGQLTINFGLRFEQVEAYTDENQLSPRINAVYQVDKNTAFHAGYARYFDPPQLMNISPGTVSQFDNTTNAADLDTDNPVKAERSHYVDAGVTHHFLPGLEVGVDGYYKQATDQIDDGQFGAANIRSPYNYATASMYGAELSVNYTHEGFSAYGNFAAMDSWARNIVASQFEFGADELAYISNHNVRFDQQQFYTASAGASYTWMDSTIHGDVLYGDGIRSGFANQDKLQSYYPVNLGIGHTFKKIWGAGDLTVRFDVLNVFDQVYVLNSGTGIGEGAVKYGNRRGFYAGLTYEF
ncbi:MAG: TonB-dependent receptor [Methylacidiphilales bacterium]|nr:TonB-dependent receptor [Candidatus Methylacidiphilales bacterium]